MSRPPPLRDRPDPRPAAAPRRPLVSARGYRPNCHDCRDDIRHVVVFSVGDHFVDRVLVPARQCFDKACGRHYAAIFGFHFAGPGRANTDWCAIDPDSSIAQADTVAGEADHALDLNLRAVAWPSEHNHVTALWQRGENTRGIRQYKKGWQRSHAVTIREFRCHEFVADEQRRLHRAGRHVERLSDCGLCREYDQHDNGYVDDILDPIPDRRVFFIRPNSDD